MLGLVGVQGVSAPLLDDFAFFVRQRYLQLGYPRAKVNWEIDGGRGLLHVEEDEPDKIGEIRFEGAGGVKEDDLRAYLLR